MEKNRIMTKKNKTTENDFCKVANRVSFITIIGNVILSVVKFLAGIIAHSNAMISDAVHSASDVFSTIVVMIGIKLAAKVADKEHPYGHERLECVAAIVLVMVLIITGLGIGAEALKNIVQGNYSDLQVPGILALIAAIVSIVSKEAMYWYTRYYAKKIDSSALMADAWHHRSDAFSSIGALIGIAGARLGFPIMDSIASLVIFLFIIKAAFDIFNGVSVKAKRKFFVENLKFGFNLHYGAAVICHKFCIFVGALGNKIMGFFAFKNLFKFFFKLAFVCKFLGHSANPFGLYFNLSITYIC